MRRSAKILLIGFGSVLLLVLTGVLVLIGPFLLGQYRLRRFEMQLQADWKSSSDLSILDAAIHEHGSLQGNFERLDLKVPHAERVTCYYISDDCMSIEYGGGFHHFGIEYHVDPRKTQDAVHGDSDKHMLNGRILYYSEDSGHR